MSQLSSQTLNIDFSDKVQKTQLPFNYSDNALYNLSIPILSVILTLSRLPKPENLELFKNLLKQYIVDLSEEGKKLDYPAAVIDKLCCLHCIVLDEFIIHGFWGEDAGWENNTLLSELFGLKNGGDLFFTVTEKALKQSAKMQDILQLCYVFLQMGFKGRYRSRQSEQLGLISKQIHQAIENKTQSANILIKDAPIAKSLFLKNGARYISFTLIILFTLTLVYAFFDYWFKETYSLRAKELTDLKKMTANYVLNTQAKDIVYISTAEDIHAVNNLTQQHPPKTSEKNMQTGHSHVDLDLSQNIGIATTRLPFRIQLATFSSKENANKYLTKIKNSLYQISMMPTGNYFIIYSEAESKLEAKKQQKYFKENYQISTIRSEVDITGTVQ
ncbi:type IVB secretion system protein IcmH/DotU [Pseudoalteromonas denitrificans]|jgi:type VI secretion system protein ImpK|uniref:Type VI secretion system protein ImpK n=1 Tax=Pseudoalteromonas denitrificans DSM 6059 TaxID=1123010 RepID=A0A1I1GM78_9GAMM|nr:type IVB secretion system protein IcmH/DotU [Pseudoalteromonas denitrificans]SFC12714.1 type VI secretion system protein ImpK [Pseudoalteromonas denitrificans DSM 6059]